LRTLIPTPSPVVAAETKTTDTDKLKRRGMLHAAIYDTFNDSELRVFVTGNLGWNYEDIEGDTLSERCLSLALMADRHGKRARLLDELRGARPHVEWAGFE